MPMAVMGCILACTSLIATPTHLQTCFPCLHSHISISLFLSSFSINFPLIQIFSFGARIKIRAVLGFPNSHFDRPICFCLQPINTGELDHTGALRGTFIQSNATNPTTAYCDMTDLKNILNENLTSQAMSRSHPLFLLY